MLAELFVGSFILNIRIYHNKHNFLDALNEKLFSYLHDKTNMQYKQFLSHLIFFYFIFLELLLRLTL